MLQKAAGDEPLGAEVARPELRLSAERMEGRIPNKLGGY